MVDANSGLTFLMLVLFGGIGCYFIIVLSLLVFLFLTYLCFIVLGEQRHLLLCF